MFELIKYSFTDEDYNKIGSGKDLYGFNIEDFILKFNKNKKFGYKDITKINDIFYIKKDKQIIPLFISFFAKYKITPFQKETQELLLYGNNSLIKGFSNSIFLIDIDDNVLLDKIINEITIQIKKLNIIVNYFNQDEYLKNAIIFNDLSLWFGSTYGDYVIQNSFVDVKINRYDKVLNKEYLYENVDGIFHKLNLSIDN